MQQRIQNIRWTVRQIQILIRTGKISELNDLEQPYSEIYQYLVDHVSLSCGCTSRKASEYVQQAIHHLTYVEPLLVEQAQTEAKHLFNKIQESQDEGQ